MIRKGFVMEVNPDMHAEYERRHNPVWPELKEVMEAQGLRNYSIFLLPETNQLFAYVEVEDEQAFGELAKNEVCQKWWKSLLPPSSTPKVWRV